MDNFWREIEVGEIHLRDRWQFELKSEFSTAQRKNIYIQEFYIFIPTSLQINDGTYTKQKFYQDQTNFIRYKTPEFTFNEILDSSNSKSPFTRIQQVVPNGASESGLNTIKDELKLLGNIVRSALRDLCMTIIKKMQIVANQEDVQEIRFDLHQLAHDVEALRKRFNDVQEGTLQRWKDAILRKNFEYIDEFVSDAIDYYLTSLLETMRRNSTKEWQKEDNSLCQILRSEEEFRQKRIVKTAEQFEQQEYFEEFLMHRRSLLNKFVLEALLLNTSRSSVVEKYRNFIGSMSAGIAMLIYLILLLWQGGNLLAIQSQPYILLTVVFYIIKDRLKEGLKSLSYEHAFKWFSDYTTEIRSPDGKAILGKVKESFSFIDQAKLPKEISERRAHEEDRVLEEFTPPEQVMYYKKTVEIKERLEERKSRRYDLNIIFRFNIQPFVYKADEPYQTYVSLDPQTLKFSRTRLPKVYHVNVLLKNTYQGENNSLLTEIKKYRLVIDKNGIKHVEHD